MVTIRPICLNLFPKESSKKQMNWMPWSDGYEAKLLFWVGFNAFA